MGFSKDYPEVPDWVEKPEGYQTDSKVKYEGNVFIANFWASKPGEGEANENGWRLYDELYDVTSSPSGAPARIIGYIPTWRKKEEFDYANAEMYRHITHGIISFLMFSETDLGEFEPKSVEDVDAILADVVLTAHECGTYISIALGGATDYGFLSLMERIGSNPGDTVLQKAVKNVVDFVNTNGLDGVDLDLECWWDKNNDANKDQGGRLKSDGPHAAGKGLTEFAKQLKQAMPDKLISAALFATSWYGNCYDPGLAEYVDWLGIMTYDLTGSWNQSPVGPQSALLKIREQKVYAEEQQGEWPGNSKSSGNKTDPMSDNPILSVEDSLWYWTNPFFTNWQGKGQNIPRNKIAAGVPIYGYDFAYGKDPDDLSGQIAPGYKVIRYKDILSQFPDAPTAANGNIKVPGNTPRPPFVSGGGSYPYAHNIYFETPDTAVTKLNFLKSVGAQGVIIWELSNDIWQGGTIGIRGGSTSVIQALYQNSGNPASRPAIPSLPSLKRRRPDLGDDGTSVGDDNFGEQDNYDTGTSPDIALNNGNVVVEVHETGGNSLWYRLGQVNEKNTISWGNDGKSSKYDSGISPSVAINNNGLVVEAHRTVGLKNTLWYRLGQVEGDTITWRNDGKSIKYDNGEEPIVAINNNGLVVEVHISGGLSGGVGANLWYRLGQVEGDTITWRNDDKSIKFDSGMQPSVAITDDGLVVVAHTSSSTLKDDLWYRLGQVEGDTIRWRNDEKSIKYDVGASPSVAITNDGLVVEVHNTGGSLAYRLGQVEGDTIAWRNDDQSKNYGDGWQTSVACNGQIAVETHVEGDDKLFCSVLTLPAFRSNWINLQGENSYSYCACNSTTDNKQRHASSHTMKIEAGAPYFYAVLTKDDDSFDFPTGAILTIEGPDGTKYDRDIQEENQLVIMSGSSVRCLIVKDPKPGDWKMTMTVPEGVGFHCECNTVPTTDVYDTMTKTLEKSLQKRFLVTGSGLAAYLGPAVAAGIAIGIGGAVNEVMRKLLPLFVSSSTGTDKTYLNYSKTEPEDTDGKSKSLSIKKATQIGRSHLTRVWSIQKKPNPKQAADQLRAIAEAYTKLLLEEKKKGKIPALITWNMQGSNWNNAGASPWDRVKQWFIESHNPRVPYRIDIACLQECGSPPSGNVFLEQENFDGIIGLDYYIWLAFSDRDPLGALYILHDRGDFLGNRVNLAIVTTKGIEEAIRVPGLVKRPLLGTDYLGAKFFSIHASSSDRAGEDAKHLLGRVQREFNSPWWVAGDYNQEPQQLRDKLSENPVVDAIVCPPADITRPASSAKLDYAVRNAPSDEKIGDIHDSSNGLSDHLPVRFLLL